MSTIPTISRSRATDAEICAAVAVCADFKLFSGFQSGRLPPYTTSLDAVVPAFGDHEVVLSKDSHGGWECVLIKSNSIKANEAGRTDALACCWAVIAANPDKFTIIP